MRELAEDHDDEQDDAGLQAAKREFMPEDDEDDFDEPGSGPGIVGPFGIIPLHEHNAPSKLFNFWMGHTNFDVNPDVKNAIESVPGVESLDIFTRYRFRISFGKAFDAESVMKAIEETLIQATPDPKPVLSQAEVRLATLGKQLGKKHKYWAVIIDSDGKMLTSSGDDHDQVKQEVDQLRGQAKQIVTSWE